VVCSYLKNCPGYHVGVSLGNWLDRKHQWYRRFSYIWLCRHVGLDMLMFDL
jgi:hypothetical protein